MQGWRNLEWSPLNVSLQEFAWRKIIMKTQSNPSQNAFPNNSLSCHWSQKSPASKKINWQWKLVGIKGGKVDGARKGVTHFSLKSSTVILVLSMSRSILLRSTFAPTIWKGGGRCYSVSCLFSLTTARRNTYAQTPHRRGLWQCQAWLDLQELLREMSLLLPGKRKCLYC